MKVKVRHYLAGVLSRVRHGPVTGFSDARCFRHVLHGGKHMTQHCGVVSVQVIHRSEVLLRNHQYMNRSLRVNVVKGQYQVIFIDLIGWYQTGDNLAKNTVC